VNISILEKDIKELVLIKPLWEKLKFIHLDKSVYFKNKFKKFTFDQRMEQIYEKSQNGVIKFDMILDNDNGNYVGYCLSSMKNNFGEIESIFVEDEYRMLRLGDKLMKNALNWFELNKITNISISVVYANDDVLPFYERYGFHVGNYILKRN